MNIRRITAALAVSAATALAFAAVPTPAQATSSSPVQSLPASMSPARQAGHIDIDVEAEAAERSVCRISGIVGWFGGMIGGNDVCGDDYDHQLRLRHRYDYDDAEIIIDNNRY